VNVASALLTAAPPERQDDANVYAFFGCDAVTTVGAGG